MMKPLKSQTITRRTFVARAGIAGAALSSRLQGRVRAADEEGKTVTLAFVGCAHIHTPGFIKLLNGRKDVKVKYVWDHDAARAAKRAGELKAVVAAKPGEIWSDNEIAGVVICSETNRHHELVTAAAEAGKHMFVDAIKGRKDLPLVTPREAAARVSVMEAMYQGSREHKWVKPA
jgi:predicted dehydrogenase